MMATFNSGSNHLPSNSKDTATVMALCTEAAFDARVFNTDVTWENFKDSYT